jgi:hypothetical protein
MFKPNADKIQDELSFMHGSWQQPAEAGASGFGTLVAFNS